MSVNKTTKRSLKDKVYGYIMKNLDLIVPGILMIGGTTYYPENRQCVKKESKSYILGVVQTQYTKKEQK